jgi:hypothetical protein
VKRLKAEEDLTLKAFANSSPGLRSGNPGNHTALFLNDATLKGFASLEFGHLVCVTLCSKACEAGGSIKPGVERSGTPGRINKQPQARESGRQIDRLGAAIP